MNNWNDIKNRILFSYLGCDWTSIFVDQKEAKQVKKYLEKNVNLKISNGEIFKFENASTEVCFYLNSNHHFDFDPKMISNEDQWNKFLDLFKKMSKDLKSDILFRPEDSLQPENIIIRISNNKVEYFFEVYEAYKN